MKLNGFSCGIPRETGDPEKNEKTPRKIARKSGLFLSLALFTMHLVFHTVEITDLFCSYRADTNM